MVLEGESEIILRSLIVMQISNALTQAHPTDINTVDHHFVINGGNADQTQLLIYNKVSIIGAT